MGWICDRVVETGGIATLRRLPGLKVKLVAPQHAKAQAEPQRHQQSRNVPSVL
jgi:hypothetical protein